MNRACSHPASLEAVADLHSTRGALQHKGLPPALSMGGDTYCEKSQINHHPNVAFQRDRHLFIYLSTDRLNIILRLYLYLYRVADILSVYLGADLNSY